MLDNQAMRLFAAVQVVRQKCHVRPGGAEVSLPMAAYMEVEAAASAIEHSRNATAAAAHQEVADEIAARSAFADELARFCRKWMDYEPTRREAAALLTAWEKVAPRFQRGG